MNRPEYSSEEIARRAREIYEREIRESVETRRTGEFLVVDVESGDYEVADEALAATRALKERKPSAVLYLMRVGPNGATAAYRLARLGRGGTFAPALKKR